MIEKQQHFKIFLPDIRKNRLTRRKRNPIPRQLTDSKSYTFYKCVDKGLLTSTSGAEGLYSFNVKLSDLSEVASFTSVFDQYRIRMMKVEIHPAVQLSTTVTSSPPYSFLYVVTDYDDSTNLASASLALNYQNLKIVGAGKGLTRSIKPHVNSYAAEDPNTAQPAETRVSPWLDCAQTAIAHYGLKCAVLQQTSTNIVSWRIWIHYLVDFRMVR